jgi:hypothetical protein
MRLACCGSGSQTERDKSWLLTILIVTLSLPSSLLASTSIHPSHNDLSLYRKYVCYTQLRSATLVTETQTMAVILSVVRWCGCVENLSGIKVGHGFDDFKEGETRILTLKDASILDGDGLNEGVYCIMACGTIGCAAWS